MPRKRQAESMDAEIKLRVSREDKDRFEAEAAKMRLTVSAWLRLAGVEKLERNERK